VEPTVKCGGGGKMERVIRDVANFHPSQNWGCKRDRAKERRSAGKFYIKSEMDRWKENDRGFVDSKI
jgi:hypothetical protein